MVKPIHARRIRAFALIDVIVATIILGSALAVIVGLTARALSSQTAGQELTTAAHLADEQLQLILLRGPDDYARRFTTQGVCEAPFQDYRYTLTFTGGGTISEPYSVAATISWNSTGIPRSVTINTLIASRSGNPDGDTEPLRTPPTTVNRNP
jgi:type II secretory pathway pseudopilin PulG